MTTTGGVQEAASAPDAALGRRFRPDVEGLRAIAVAVVIAFHAGIERVGGGFIGVDVFFVISGFLITGLIVGEIGRTGRLSIPAFYSRRFRRILPAASVVFLATLVITRVALSPLDRSDIALDGVATALFSMNLREIATNSDYLRDAPTSPFLHYWSLAVEEQFYVVWPLLMVGLSALARRSRQAPARVLAAGIGAVGAVSFAVCIWLTAVHPVWGFHLLGSRAWELAAGALVAVAVPRLTRLPQGLAAVLGWVGLATIGLSALLFSETMSFPGWRAAIPVGGTVLVIAAGCARPRWGPETVLSLAPMLWIGKLSFSLYLWHWPILVALEDEPRSRAIPIMVVALAILSPLTYLLVENPVRRWPWLAAPPRRGIILGAGLTAMLLVAVPVVLPKAVLDSGKPAPPPTATVGATVEVPAGDPPPADYVPSDLVPTLAEAPGLLEELDATGCLTRTSSDVSGPCEFGDLDGEQTIVLFGDSHAFHWQPALEELARAEGWRLVVLTKAGCPWPEVSVLRRGSPYPSCDRWRADTLERIAEIAPAAVVLGVTREGLLPGAADAEESDRLWREGAEATLAALPDASRALVMGPSPRFSENVPRCLAENLEDPGACEQARDDVVDEDFAALLADAAEAKGAASFDTAAQVCWRDPCPVIAWNLLVYSDENHLTGPMVRAKVPQLRAVLAPLVGGGT